LQVAEDSTGDSSPNWAKVPSFCRIDEAEVFRGCENPQFARNCGPCWFEQCGRRKLSSVGDRFLSFYCLGFLTVVPVQRQSLQGHKTFIRRTFSMVRPHRWFEQNFRNRMRLIRTRVDIRLHLRPDNLIRRFCAYGNPSRAKVTPQKCSKIW